MLHTTLMGIEKEPVRVWRCPAEGIPRHPANLRAAVRGSDRKIEAERTPLVAVITVISPTKSSNHHSLGHVLLLSEVSFPMGLVRLVRSK
jgi:hypothetical protein